MKTKMKNKMLVIGFEEYNEKMYPHTYDVLTCLHRDFELNYYGGDDRGGTSLQKGALLASRPWKLSLLSALQTIKAYKREYRIKKDIKRLFSEKSDVILVIDHSAMNYVYPHLTNEAKLVFWSHDILTPDHFWVNNSKFVRELVKKNSRYSNRIDLILVQDHCRADVLDSVIGSQNVRKFYLPVSLFPDEQSVRITRLKNSTQTLAGKISLIQVGSIHEFKSSHDILTAYQQAGQDIELTLLGHISEEMRKMSAVADRKPVLYDVQSSYAVMRQIIAANDIGIIGAKQKNQNNYFYSMACGQIVEFSRFGMPVIVVDSDELGEFVEKNNCGLYVRDLNFLDQAIETIKKNYSLYSRNISRVYAAHYDLQIYQKDLIAALQA